MNRTTSRAAVAGALLLAGLLAVAVSGCTKPGSQGASSTTSTPEATSTANGLPTLEQLSKASLTEMKQSLVFTYVQVGGIPALESRFGKPTATYSTYAKDGAGGWCELPDGRTYRFEWGFDSTGKAVVMCHIVEASKASQKPTAADKAFVSTIVDGKTTMEEANAYIRRVGGKKAHLAALDASAIKVPGLVWAQPDDSGFIVIDLTSLTPDQMASIGMEDMGPYQALYWSASRWIPFEG